MKNPECLGEFVKALTQSEAQKIPTPSAPCGNGGDGGDGEGLAARKAFWSKYKRPIGESGQLERSESMKSILSKPTLILGETVPDDTLTATQDVAVVVTETVPPTTQGLDVAMVVPELVPPTTQDGVLTETVPPTTQDLDVAMVVPELVPPTTQDGVLTETVPPTTQDPGVAAVTEMVPPTTQDVVVPETVPPTLDVAPVVTSPEPPKDIVVCSVRARLQKMDSVELSRAVEAAKGHCCFPEFLMLAAKTADDFGATDMVEDLACFQYHLDFSDAQPPAVQTQTSQEAAPTPTPDAATPKPEEPPIAMETDSKVVALQNSEVPNLQPEAPAPSAIEANPSKAPTVPPGNQSVATALTRMQTVDLDSGMRPPQSLTETGNEGQCQTVVLLSLNGLLQPVTLPMTPEQCVAAGLTVANIPNGSGDDVKGDGVGKNATGATPSLPATPNHEAGKPPVPEERVAVEEDWIVKSTDSYGRLNNFYRTTRCIHFW